MRKVLEVLRFMVGFANMHPTENIEWEDGDLGPMPLGYMGSHAVSFFGGWILMTRYWLGHPLNGHPFSVSDAIAFGLLSGGFLIGLVYPVAMTIMNWGVYALRTRQWVAHRPVGMREQIADLRMRANQAILDQHRQVQ